MSVSWHPARSVVGLTPTVSHRHVAIDSMAQTAPIPTAVSSYSPVYQRQQTPLSARVHHMGMGSHVTSARHLPQAVSHVQSRRVLPAATATAHTVQRSYSVAGTSLPQGVATESGRTVAILYGPGPGPKQQPVEQLVQSLQQQELEQSYQQDEASAEPSMALLNMLGDFIGGVEDTGSMPAEMLQGIGADGPADVVNCDYSEVETALHIPDANVNGNGVCGDEASEIQRLREELAEERRRSAQLESMYLASLVSRDDRQVSHARDIAMLEDMLRRLYLDKQRLEAALAQCDPETVARALAEQARGTSKESPPIIAGLGAAGGGVGAVGGIGGGRPTASELDETVQWYNPTEAPEPSEASAPTVAFVQGFR